MRTYVRTYVGCQFHGDIVLLGGVQEYGQEEKTVPTMRLRMRACVYLQCADERANVRTDLAPVPSSPTAAVWARAFRFEQRCPFVPSLQPGYVRACVRTLHTRGRGRPEDLRMPWIGVVLRRWTNVDQTSCGVRSTVHCCPEFCVEFDIKRKAWELPKGGVQPSRDTSPYATARRELWEEAGVWLQWRERGTSTWASPKGDVLGEAPSADKHAWLVTDVLPYDEIDLRRPPMWMSLARFRQISPRDDHVKVLETVALLQHCKMKTVHLQANERGGPPL